MLPSPGSPPWGVVKERGEDLMGQAALTGGLRGGAQEAYDKKIPPIMKLSEVKPEQGKEEATEKQSAPKIMQLSKVTGDKDKTDSPEAKIKKTETVPKREDKVPRILTGSKVPEETSKGKATPEHYLRFKPQDEYTIIAISPAYEKDGSKFLHADKNKTQVVVVQNGKQIVLWGQDAIDILLKNKYLARVKKGRYHTTAKYEKFGPGITQAGSEEKPPRILDPDTDQGDKFRFPDFDGWERH